MSQINNYTIESIQGKNVPIVGIINGMTQEEYVSIKTLMKIFDFSLKHYVSPKDVNDNVALVERIFESQKDNKLLPKAVKEIQSLYPLDKRLWKYIDYKSYWRNNRQNSEFLKDTEMAVYVLEQGKIRITYGYPIDKKFWGYIDCKVYWHNTHKNPEFLKDTEMLAFILEQGEIRMDTGYPLDKKFWGYIDRKAYWKNMRRKLDFVKDEELILYLLEESSNKINWFAPKVKPIFRKFMDCKTLYRNVDSREYNKKDPELYLYILETMGAKITRFVKGLDRICWTRMDCNLVWQSIAWSEVKSEDPEFICYILKNRKCSVEQYKECYTNLKAKTRGYSYHPRVMNCARFLSGETIREYSDDITPEMWKQLDCKSVWEDIVKLGDYSNIELCRYILSKIDSITVYIPSLPKELWEFYYYNFVKKDLYEKNPEALSFFLQKGKKIDATMTKEPEEKYWEFLDCMSYTFGLDYSNEDFAAFILEKTRVSISFSPEILEKKKLWKYVNVKPSDFKPTNHPIDPKFMEDWFKRTGGFRYYSSDIPRHSWIYMNCEEVYHNFSHGEYKRLCVENPDLIEHIMSHSGLKIMHFIENLPTKLWRFMDCKRVYSNMKYHNISSRCHLSYPDMMLYILERIEETIDFVPGLDKRLWKFCDKTVSASSTKNNPDAYLEFCETMGGRLNTCHKDTDRRLWKYVEMSSVSNYDLTHLPDFCEFYMKNTETKITDYIPDLEMSLWKYSDYAAVIQKIPNNKKSIFNPELGPKYFDSLKDAESVKSALATLNRDPSATEYIKFLFKMYFMIHEDIEIDEEEEESANEVEDGEVEEENVSEEEVELAPGYWFVCPKKK